MYYFFLDESYTPIRSRKEIVMAGWAVQQEKFDNYMPKLHELYRSPVLKSIDSMFASIDARARVTKATLDNVLFRPGELVSPRISFNWPHGSLTSSVYVRSRSLKQKTSRGS
jgi:hypothetical protein